MLPQWSTCAGATVSPVRTGSFNPHIHCPTPGSPDWALTSPRYRHVSYRRHPLPLPGATFSAATECLPISTSLLSALAVLLPLCLPHRPSTPEGGLCPPYFLYPGSLFRQHPDSNRRQWSRRTTGFRRSLVAEDTYEWWQMDMVTYTLKITHFTW